ncbi:hypothetical protein SSX86_006081 [Deinandra increscens subsp. villosa]|uniref:Uncharacterized protein n=1 Tax=Deinandra increscens subsp. villosa TaxID=3103831 RepID=A0AAP0H928_9ASTR
MDKRNRRKTATELADWIMDKLKNIEKIVERIEEEINTDCFHKPEGSLDSTAATGNRNGGHDWQEEVCQQIKAMKDLSLLDSAAQTSNRTGEDRQEDVYQKIKAMKDQHDSYPQQPETELFKTLELLKNMLGRLMQSLQIHKQQYMQKQQLMQQDQFHQHLQSHEDLVKAMNDLDLLDSTAESGNQNGEDWQEEAYQKHASLPQQPRNEQLEKLKVYKNMMERLMQFLQIPKHRILIGYKDKLGTYEKLIINVINSNRRKPTPPLQQTQAFPPPPMQSLQSQRQLKKLIKAMKDLDPLDAAAQTGNLNGEDWQEEVFQKINTLRDLYLPDVNSIQRKLSKLPQCDSLYQKVTKEQHEKLKVYKNLLDRYVQFLQVPKHEISPYHKDKLGNYEMQIANVVRLKRRRQAALQPEAQGQAVDLPIGDGGKNHRRSGSRSGIRECRKTYRHRDTTPPTVFLRLSIRLI